MYKRVLLNFIFTLLFAISIGFFINKDVSALISGWSPTFGTNGFVANDGTAGGTAPSDELGYGIDVQADGKVLISGDGTNASGNLDMVMIRYNSDGSLDTSFNTDGIVTYDGGHGDDSSAQVQVASDGSVFVVGYITNSSGNQDTAIWKYTSSGMLDSSFGTNGLATLDSGSGDDKGEDIYILPNGNLLVTGAINNTNSDLALWRILSDGTFDAGFSTGDGNDGVALCDANTEIGNELRVLPDGKILVGGTGDLIPGGGLGPDTRHIYVCQYSSEGIIDTSFGLYNGFSYYSFGAEQNNLTSIDLQTNGKIVGTVFGMNSMGWPPPVYYFRMDSDGTLDTTLDTDGVVSLPANFYAADILFIPNTNKYIIAGQMFDTYEFHLCRYNSDGTADTTFNGTGCYIHPLTGYSQAGISNTALVLGSHNEIYIAGSTWNDTSNDSDIGTWVFEEYYQIADLLSLSAIRSDTNSVEVGSSYGINGEENVTLKTDDGYLLASVPVSFSEDVSWSTVKGAVDTEAGKSVVANLDSAPGVTGQHSLYIPKGEEDNTVYICPDATNLSQVIPTCKDVTTYEHGDDGVSVIESGGEIYWKIDNLSGTGGGSILIELSQTGRDLRTVFLTAGAVGSFTLVTAFQKLKKRVWN